MKKLFALLLALTMVFSLATTAFAEETATTYSITINNATDGYTYGAWQIFTGDLSNVAENDNDSGTSATLSNVQWGSSVTYNGEGVAVEGSTEKSTKAADVAAALAAGDLTLDTLLDDLTLGSSVATTSTMADGKYVISGLAAGYYLVKNTAVPADGVYTEYIVEVLENSTVTPKSDLPEFQKKIKDTNDSVANSTTDWQDSADYDIGDDVPFQLKATLPNNVTAYDAYKVVFHDTMSEGLTFNASSVVVKVGETVVDSSKYTVVTENLTDGCTFEVVINDVKAEGVGAGNNSVITVEYTALLNDKAVLGSTGNPNVANLEYSNNPNADGEGNTGKTPKDKVIVFTYKVIVNKTDSTGKALTGAGFTLYKKTGTNDAGETVWTQIGNELTGEAMTTFEWKGLDDGDYKLEETTTPAGYNTIDPIEFTVTAGHDTLSDNPALTSLTGTAATGEITFTADTTAGSLSTDIVNKAGTELPETGGMGTTLFYIVGGIMVVAAVVLLVTKKRMGAEA